MKHEYSLAWLDFLGQKPPVGDSPKALALQEFDAYKEQTGYTGRLSLKDLGQQEEGYAISKTYQGYQVEGSGSSLLHGAYRLLMKLAAGEDPLLPFTRPVYALRMINHWDNMDGHVERGYAGRSLFFEGGHFQVSWPRLRQYARLLASMGVNAVSINNVNVKAPADGLITQALLPQLKEVADALRPFGIRLLAAIDYSLPHSQGLGSADPLDTRVQRFWNMQADLVYAYIPDFLGFLVKADSEYRPGPFTYGRDHAQGANMLARALAPHGGVLIWRCFVYNHLQDWRDSRTDRPCAAYHTYAPLDGQFDSNVILQIKNGPYDFQVREPVSPLFFAMPQTTKALEIQLAQEYTGHQIDLCYLPPLWEEVHQDLGEKRPRHICAVSNTGRDHNWCGHELAQANLFAYGLHAYFGRVSTQDLQLWIRLSFGQNGHLLSLLSSMMLRSRQVYEGYTAPLALGWMVKPHSHYGPSPEGYEYDKWGTYLRCDRDGVGIDRSSRGTGYSQQYESPLREIYDNVDTCPQELLLFFHRLRFDHILPDGRSLIQYIYDSRFEGYEGAVQLLEDWQSLQGLMPQERHQHSLKRFELQKENAREWRDVLNNYFYRFSGVPDAKGRKIY